MKVLALLTDPSVSHTMWRITRPFDALKKVGVETHYLHSKGWGTPDGITWDKRFLELDFLKHADVVILPRMTIYKESREDFVRWVGELRRHDVTVIYETDDDVFTSAWPKHFKDCGQGNIEEHIKDTFRNKWILNQVDGITTSTQHLADVISKRTGVPVVVIPNAIDVEAFEAGLIKNSTLLDCITIGWAAGYRPEKDAEDVAKAWKVIAEEYKDVMFVIAGWQQECLMNAVPVDRCITVPFLDMKNYPVGMQVDIGCCAAAPTEFNKSRGPGKAFEYALAGAAVVATSTVYEGTIRHNENGYIARDEYEWHKALVNLIEHEHIRRGFATVLKNEVLERYALDKNLWRWMDAWKAIKYGSSIALSRSR